jgi:8-oxo-dGTP diphosphatase
MTARPQYPIPFTLYPPFILAFVATFLFPFSFGEGMYKLGFKAWLEQDGRFVLGEGRAELLRAIKKHKSLRAAAGRLGISYRHAWGMLRRMNIAAGHPLVKSVRGGRQRGLTELTARGEETLGAYEAGLRRLCRSRGPWLTVDAVVERDGKVLLVRRRNPPFEAMYALPGGFVEAGETVEQAVVREVREETGLQTSISRILGVYSDPARDPRGHTVSVIFEIGSKMGAPKGGDDATEAGFFPLDRLPPLAFDHDRVVADYIKKRG